MRLVSHVRCPQSSWYRGVNNLLSYSYLHVPSIEDPWNFFFIGLLLRFFCSHILLRSQRSVWFYGFLGVHLSYFWIFLTVWLKCIEVVWWFCTCREDTEVFMQEIQSPWRQRLWITSISVVEPSLGHLVVVMKPQR